MKVKQLYNNITSNYLKNLLRARGVENVEQFLNPTMDDIQDWRDLINIEKGATLLLEKLNGNKPFALIVDCDVDGYTSATIIHQYIKRLKPNQEIEIFLHEGKQHGLEDTHQFIGEKDYGLVISPDAASNDIQYMEMYPESMFLVIDHHEIDRKIAENCVVINNQISPNYHNKQLSGAGVVWQFCRALDYFSGNDWANDYIDLAALGVCADMMSALEIENQAIWKYGFVEIKNPFFKALCEKQKYSMNSEITPTTVAFYIAPLINAMIRMGTMEEKERMAHAFINGDDLVPSGKRGESGQLTEIANEAVRECINKKTHQKKLQEQITESLEMKIAKEDLLSNQILVIELDDEDDDFPSELNGLVATMLSQKHKRPTMIGRVNSEGKFRGSIRGLSKSALPDFKGFLLESGLFDFVMGHALASGFEMKASDKASLLAYANDKLKDINFTETYYDVDFTRRAVDSDIIPLIEELYEGRYLWSVENNEPLINITDLNVRKEDIQILGAQKNTIKIVKNGVSYMKFFATEMIEEISKLDEIKINLIGTANINTYGGNITPQIFIQNYEIKNNKFGF